MKAMMANDMCFSTIGGRLGAVFNTDGVKRDVIDPREARRAFEFDIERRPSYDERGVRIPGQFHLVKSTDMSFIQSYGVGSRFTPIQHRSVYDFIVDKVLTEVDDMRLETVGTLYGGGVGIVVATIGDEYRVAGDQSPIQNRIFFVNPCNGRGSLVLGTSIVRAYCQNQISVGVRDAERAGFVVRHTRNANFHLTSAKSALMSSAMTLCELRSRIDRLAKTQADTAALTRVLDRIYPIGKRAPGTPGATRIANLRDEVIEQFEAGETALTMTEKTAWTVLNALTFPLFNPKDLTSRTDEAGIVLSGMIGDKASKVLGLLRMVEEECL